MRRDGCLRFCPRCSSSENPPRSPPGGDSGGGDRGDSETTKTFNLVKCGFGDGDRVTLEQAHAGQGVVI